MTQYARDNLQPLSSVRLLDPKQLFWQKFSKTPMDFTDAVCTVSY
jgi:superfamily I DNA and RNA helicase